MLYRTADMSLATLDGVRPVSFLPTIKCSTCGDEIAIAAMGDHVCRGEMPAPLTTRSHTPNMSNPFTLRQLNASGNGPSMTPLPLQQSNSEPAVPQSRTRTPTPSSNQNGPSKASRIALPKINPDAANRTYLAPRPTGLESPDSPGTSMRSAKPGYQRSATSPMPRLYDPRPPSPELSANLDCAFPPWPSMNPPPSRPPTSQGRRTPTGSDRAPSRGTSRFDRNLGAEEEPFNLEPKSANASASENVLQKLNTLKSGPFAGTRRQGTGDSNASSPLPSSGRRPSAPAVEPLARPATAQSNRSRSRGRPSTPQSNRVPREPSEAARKAPPLRPNRPDDEILSPSFLDQFSAEPDSVLPLAVRRDEAEFGRDHSYPLAQMSHERPDSQTLSKARSEPNLLSAITPSQLPVRTDSRAGTRMDYRMRDAPPVPKPVAQHQKSGNHTPTESASSLASTTRSGCDTKSNHSSNGPSPPGSSKTSVEAFDTYENDADKIDGARVLALHVRNQQSPGERAELPKQSSPPRALAKPIIPKETPQKPFGMPRRQPLESPMDPALQSRAGPTSQWATYEPWGPAIDTTSNRKGSSDHEHLSVQSEVRAPAALSVSKHAEATSATSRMARSGVARSASPTSSAGPDYAAPSVKTASSRTQSPSAPRLPPVPGQASRPRTARRRPTNAKAMCRGCGQLIEGKSVKAADGRLTGRWHKACFVCKSCTKPFVTADFYVIDNEPYCEHDYHEKNGSLCHGCHRGIEGQYLETTSSSRFGNVDKKFHPRCFTCWECRTVLSDDYFEITGKVFCERHALAAMRAQARRGGPGGSLQPPGRRDMLAERRTTRLINPIMA
ncbi:uncharacterized protein MYCFIDRAFT_213566 [Pseudocercospora fijiensis CIRAD86]|uniref:LIM zinc-binding domain-containing protein n=1 Tax=Pseudocercospora fijiensis (strain CIRAD86) TaxID=383855 RepID=N1QB32_PSEFD|nr:uncharacterized protein MYCFIDRAFT_213566 [Pseudocercospora fijiensis CIRAD86]EME89201.1 hypothetical protein MYCFIDRAFT_213566 [Pseudocercospora fijiensis CIRAD86]